MVNGGFIRRSPRPLLLAGLAVIALAVIVGVGIASRHVGGNPRPDPCDGVYMGAALSGSYLDMSLTLSSLKLVNGQENPKLKMFLEWRLAMAIQSARRHIENHPVIDPVSLPTFALNFRNPVEDACRYILDNNLQVVAVSGDPRSTLMPLDDLNVVEDWVSKQPLPPRSEW